MRIVYMGTGDFAVPPLRALVQAGHEVRVVISQPDRPAGRGRQIRPTPVHAASEGLDLRHIQAEDINALDTGVLVGDAELGVVAAFGQKIGPQLIAAFPRGCVNIHGSVLPRYRGAAPFQWAMINGDETTGVTIFQLNERWDAGEIWSTREIPIRDDETAEELHDRLADLGAALIVDTLDALADGRLSPQPQDASQATRAPKLSKADGTVDWSLPARRSVRRIHGLWPWPAAACDYVSQGSEPLRIQIARAAVADEDTRPTDAFPPGAFHPDLTVQADTGRVRLIEVKPAGGKLMSFDAFANGRKVSPPARLQPVTAP